VGVHAAGRALGNLGHQVGRNTVKRVLVRHGLEPAPLRGKRMPWNTFLRTHLGAIAAADFFSVEVLTLTGLVRYLVLFVIDLQTRRVQIGGVVRQAYGAWRVQVAQPHRRRGWVSDRQAVPDSRSGPAVHR
jgi:hypothetical protein